MNADAIRAAQAEYDAARERVQELRERRDEIVREANRDGWSYARLGRLLGVTKARAGQMVRGY